ncbi:hypothetical protein ACFO1V_10205 [Daeguia caeni]|uniref:Carboxypeptidase regulatory-like domain-containing protein n=1 Tax=Daeguia caeni TaxID=439612 RepID=A0ABV9H6T8_9HYPH
MLLKLAAAALIASLACVPVSLAQDTPSIGGFTLPSLMPKSPQEPAQPSAPTIPIAPLIGPLPELPAQNLDIPGLGAYASPASPENNPLIQTTKLDLKARLTEDGGEIPSGLFWCVFSSDVGPDGQLPVVATAKGGSASFDLPAGSYLVHVSYGRAGATKRITLGNAPRQEVMVLDAGGMKLSAALPDGSRINSDLLRFSIYSGDESNERSLIAPDIKPDTIVRLNSGTYHVVSNYGTANATIRADIRVDAGKLTEATVQHRAAEVTLKLVREHGGEALADTSWSILNASGDVVRESAGAYASLVLIEGDYVAIAKNKDHIYQRDFKVESGKNEEVEVLANAESETSSSMN